MTNPRQRLLDDVAANADHVAGLEREHARIVAASESSNADDEHDPEGATIAYERQQLLALLQQAWQTRDDLQRALQRLDDGTYGVCQSCRGLIAAARLEARPSAATCIACAS